MTTGATGQLGLALPVQGELSGQWGNTVNNGITEYTNIAIAATLTLTGDGAVTLANTTGDASASNITSTLTGAGTVTAQFAIVRVTGTLTTAKVVTAPSYSKTYVVDNAATGGVVTFKASGQTGVSVAVGEKCSVYFNGTDYVKVATSTAGTVTAVSVASANGFAGTSSGGTTPALTLSTSITGVLKGNATAISAATAGTDYLAPPSGTAILKANSGGALANATAGTDYLAPPSGTALLKANSGGALANAVAGTDYVTPTGSETLSNKTLTNPTVTNYVESVVAIGTVTSSSTLSLTSGTVQTATLTASTACTFTMPTATAGKSFILLLKQATSTGAGTATFTSVKWGTAGAPTVTSTAGAMDIFTFVADGTNWYGSVVQGYTP
jgi:hypothetical protein